MTKKMKEVLSFEELWANEVYHVAEGYMEYNISLELAVQITKAMLTDETSEGLLAFWVDESLIYELDDDSDWSDVNGAIEAYIKLYFRRHPNQEPAKFKY